MRLQDLGLPVAISANGTASVVVPTNHKHYKQLTKLDDYNLTGSDGPPDLPTMRFTPKPKPKKDKFILFWAYGDDEDTPYIIRNPPKTLGKLLTECNALDRKMTAGDDVPEWDYVNKWLKKRGVDIVEASKEVRLDDYQSENDE